MPETVVANGAARDSSRNSSFESDIAIRTMRSGRPGSAGLASAGAETFAAGAPAGANFANRSEKLNVRSRLMATRV